MPRMTLTIADAKFTRLVAALETFRIVDEEGNPAETNGQLVRRWVRESAAKIVHRHESSAARDAVPEDLGIIDKE